MAVDLVRAALFPVMALPGVPLVALLGLLTVSAVVGSPWGAARQALIPLGRPASVHAFGVHRFVSKRGRYQSTGTPTQATVQRGDPLRCSMKP